MATIIIPEEKIITRIYVGNSLVYPSLPPSQYGTNMSFDDTHTNYQSSDISTSSGSGYTVYGWTTDGFGGWSCGGAFKYGGTGSLGGTIPPTSNPIGVTTGGCLGLKLARGASGRYTQSIQLTAGNYNMTFYYYNKGSATSYATNRCGISVGGTTHYMSGTFVANVWTPVSLNFTVSSGTTATVSLGGTCANSGSGSTPTLFFDNVSIRSV